MITKIANKISGDFRRYRLSRELDAIYGQVKDYTMIDPDLFKDNLKLVDGMASIPGDVAECGVWKGGMSAGMALRDKQERHFYLFDSFEGLPQATADDGPAAVEYQKGNGNFEKFHDNCTVAEIFATKIMQKTGKPFTTIKGWFENTLPFFSDSTNLAILRMDGDWYESTMTTLVHMYPKVVSGGVIIIDDYHAWDGCTKAVHDYLSSIKSISRINRTQNGVAYWIKRD